MIVDMHNHFVPIHRLPKREGLPTVERGSDGSVDLVTPNGTRTPLISELTDVTLQTESMRRMGVDHRTLAVPPFCFQYELPATKGQEWSRAMNDGIAETASKSGGQLIGFATVPLQDVEIAIAELVHAVASGHEGVEIATNINGVDLDDRSLDPFWARCEEIGLPVLVHPHYVAGVERMNEYHLRNLIGNPLETALAGARLIFGGVLERFPRIKIILSHGGGALPALAGRLDHGRKVRSELNSSLDLQTQLRSLYYDSIVFDKQIFRYLLDVVGPDRIVLGTDHPFDMSEASPVQFVKESARTNQGASIILSQGKELLTRY